MNFRITDDGDARDIHEIYELLKAYNLSRREASQNVPIGVCGIDGRNLWQLALHPISFCQRTAPGPGDRRQAASGRGGRGQKTWLQIAFVDTFSFQAPAFYKKHDYREVFTLEEYPYTGQRHYYTKKLL